MPLLSDRAFQAIPMTMAWESTIRSISAPGTPGRLPEVVRVGLKRKLAKAT